jgi:hypothetical protein
MSVGNNPFILAVDADSLPELDNGAGRLIINKAIQEAIYDLEDRAAEDRKSRKVQILLTLDLLPNGTVSAKLDAVAKLPVRQAAATFGELHGRGRDMKVVFRKYSPDDPSQSTIEEITDAIQGQAAAGS